MAKDFFSQEEQTLIVEAIKAAELNTSGEVQVHVEQRCPGKDALVRAKKIFERLGMHRTQARNGVLFYIAYEDKMFAVLGDQGIDEKVSGDFWDATKLEMEQYFKKGEFASGLAWGITQAGINLKSHFPFQSGDVNELSDHISFGDDSN